MPQLGVPLAILAKIQKAGVGAAVNEAWEIELDEAEGKILLEMTENLPPEAYSRLPHPPLLTIKEFRDGLEEVINGTG